MQICQNTEVQINREICTEEMTGELSVKDALNFSWRQEERVVLKARKRPGMLCKLFC